MGDNDSKKEEKVIVKVKNATDLQRLKLEKLMKNPDKPIVIPDRPRDKTLSSAPDFVRNVMGSSAGAGSGEFHVYRHLRRKEYARQKFIVEKSEKEKLDEEYHNKIEQNKRLAEEKTAKKRAKRLKQKKNAKMRVKMPKTDKKNHISSESESTEDEGDNNQEKTQEHPENNYKSKTLDDVKPEESHENEQNKMSSTDDDKQKSEDQNIPINRSSGDEESQSLR